MITIGFSTREKDNRIYKEYLQKTCMYKEVEIIAKVNNGEKSLSEVYNEIIEESSNEIVVLLHDDLEFDTKNWGEKLIKVFEKNPEYSIVGLAGTKYLEKSARWWTVPSTMFGIVNHKHEGKKWASTYSSELGNKVEETILVDGLFIAFNKNKIKHGFDTSIEGFHFYDLGFCLPNYLDDVKIGITTQIRVTHLSIGQTNEQWEKNRQLFSEKYDKFLPIDILRKDYTQTFIFCHNQEYILGFEKNNKFSNLYNYTYVFLGNGETDKLSGFKNVIVARELPNNIEQYPLFTSFTGWYALWKNNLIKSDYVNLFEYDVILNQHFEQNITRMIENKIDMIGYVPFSMNNYHFLNNNRWVEHIHSAIKKTYNQDIFAFFKRIIQKNPNSIWSSTSNTTFKKSVFEEYMKWFEPLIPYLKNTETCGHAHERSITFFSYFKNKKQVIVNGLLNHFQMNSHNTQEHKIDLQSYLNKLYKNIL